MGGSESKVVWTQPGPEYLPNYDGSKPVCTWAPDSCKEPILSAKGIAALAPITVMEVMKDAVKKFGPAVALREQNAEGKWREITWNDYYKQVNQAAKSLIRLGLQPFQSVNVIGFNSPEWFIADLAAIFAGGKAAGIYTTNAPPACKYIAEHSEARVVFVEDLVQLKKFLAIRDELPLLTAIVIYRSGIEVPADANVEGKARVLTWNQFMEVANQPEAGAGAAAAAAAAPGDLDAQLATRIANQKPGHCCTLIYTSGTTGNPKAVMISHDNVTWTAQATVKCLPENPTPADGDQIVSFLPLSHIAAQMLDIHAGMAICRSGLNNSTVSFAKPDALKGSLPATLKSVRPTLFFGVPRVWEKIQEKMVAVGKETKGLKKSIATWAKAKGASKNAEAQVGGSQEKPWFFGMADSIVFSKVKGALGLDRCRFCLSGAAPIRKETVDYFAQLDLYIHEIYGMSENSGPQNMNRHNYKKSGSCGPPLPGVEVKIDHVAARGDKPGNGEVCFRGRHIMMGYMKSEEKTRGAIDADGWMHSEDIGRIDENGLLYITGRIKDLIIGAGGENIAPVPVQDAIKDKLPGISNVVMIGDKRKYNVALVTLPAKLGEDGSFTDELEGAALEVNPAVKTVSAAIKDPVWQKYIFEGIKAANKLAVSNASVVQKFRVLPFDFLEKTGELTATLKLKRNVVEEKNLALIEEMYNEPEEAAPKPAAAAAETKEAPAQPAAAAAAAP